MQKRNGLWTGALLLTVAVMIAIICFSAQSAAESDGLSKGLAQWLLDLVPSLNDMVTLRKLNRFLRKFAHFSLYFLLGCGLTGLANRQRRMQPVLLAILGGAAFAVTDEFHQFFPLRHLGVHIGADGQHFVSERHMVPPLTTQQTGAGAMVYSR